MSGHSEKSWAEIAEEVLGPADPPSTADVAKAYVEGDVKSYEDLSLDGKNELVPITYRDGIAGKPLPLLSGEELRQWNKNEVYARWVVEEAKLRFEFDVEQKLRGAIVKLFLGAEADYLILVAKGWPQPRDPDERKPAPRSLMLPELYAIADTKQMRTLGPAELKQWGTRAAIEAGLIGPPAPARLALLDGPTEPAVVTWEVIAKKLAIRLLTYPPELPMPITTPRLAAWSGVEENVLRSGKLWLRNRGYIRKVGEVHTGQPRPCDLWEVAGAHFRAPARGGR